MSNIHICACVWKDLEIRKNLSLEIPARPEIRPIRSSTIKCAYRETTEFARARALALFTGRTKNERLIVLRETADSFKIPRWPSRAFYKATSCGHKCTYGPDKPSVLAAREATSRNARVGNESKSRKKFLLVEFLTIENWLDSSLCTPNKIL